MTIHKIKASRVTSIVADDFIGTRGMLFYNEEKGDLRLSDGIRKGGVPLAFGNNSQLLPLDNHLANQVLTTDGNNNLSWTYANTIDLSAVDQSIIPKYDAAYSLGTADKRWRDIHVSNGSVFIGGLSLSNADGSLLLQDSVSSIPVDPDPHTVLRAVRDYNNYVSLSIQNTNTGPLASSDILLYQNSDTNSYFANFGIANSNYNYPGYEIIEPADTYLIGSGGNVKIGTAYPNHDIVFFTSGTSSLTNEIARFKDGQGLILQSPLSFSNGNIFSGSYIDLADKPSIPLDVSELSDNTNLLNKSVSIKSNDVLISTCVNTINFNGADVTVDKTGLQVDIQTQPTLLGINIDGGYPFSVYGGITPIDAGGV